MAKVKKTDEREVKQWITVKGRRVPIFEGESKANAVRRIADDDIAKRKVKKNTEEKKTNKTNTLKLNKKAENNGWKQKELDELNDWFSNSSDFSGTFNKDSSKIIISYQGKEFASIQGIMDIGGVGYEVIGRVGSKFDKEQVYRSMKKAIRAIDKVVNNRSASRSAKA